MMKKKLVVQVVLYKNKNMDYKYSTINVRELLELTTSGKINLSPAYQRGFIWSLPDQKALIRTISKRYPLPNLFIRVLENGKMEMVDGQQRCRTIIKFYKGEIKITNRDKIEVCNTEDFLKYTLQVAYIHNASDTEIREVYYYINKKGISLNDPERQKAYYSDTLFLKLAEDLSGNQSLINLDLFSDKSITRFNDREFIQELIGYLYMYNQDKSNNINLGFEGLRDKKLYIEREMFTNDINESEFDSLKQSFEKILEVLSVWDSLHPLNKSRYKQKSDFYTLFCFLNKYKNLEENLLKYQYQILLLLNGKDKNGEQFIRPTNDECDVLKNYAINCVSQSNSRKAREERLMFFESILLNKHSIEYIENNPSLLSLVTYLSKLYSDEKIDLVKVGDYYLIDLNLING